MKSSLVTIIMPTYNVGGLIVKTIETVLSQTYQNWELLIVDDCSTDNTRDLLKEIEKKHDRIKCFYSEKNLGAGSSRNIGLSEAKGQFIAFLDSDDLWVPEKLELQLDFMAKKNAPICHTSFSFVDSDGEARKGAVHVSQTVALEDNLRKTEIGTSTAVIDRNIVGTDFRFSHIRARQDLKLWIELLGRGHLSYGLDRELVKYRVRHGSVSSNKLKMLVVTFKVYLGVKELSLMKRLACYFSYVTNAIRKRQ